MSHPTPRQIQSAIIARINRDNEENPNDQLHARVYRIVQEGISDAIRKLEDVAREGV